MKKQIKSLSSIAAVTGLCLAFSFSASAQWSLTGNSNTIVSPASWLGTSSTAPLKDLIIKTNNIERMRILGTNGNIGIGTATPSDKLHIVDSRTTANSAGLYVQKTGAVSGTSYAIDGVVTGAGTTNVAAYFSASGATNNYGIIVPAGNVGIGTTTPSQKLEVTGTTKATTDGVPFIIQSSSTGSLPNYISWRNSAGTPRGYLGYEASNENFYIETAANANLYFATNGAVQATISGAGKVGIGTTTPGYKLDVNGELRSSGNLRITGVATGNGIIADDGATPTSSTIFSITRQPSNEVRFSPYVVNGFLTFHSSGAERMRVDANGYIGIGAGLVAPSAQLHVSPGWLTASAKAPLMRLGYLNSGAREIGMYQLVNSTSSGVEQYLFLNGQLDLTNSVFGTPKITSSFMGGTAFYVDDNGLKIITTQQQGPNISPIYALSISSTNGNVIIGTPPIPNAAYKLNVGGSVRANEVVVNTTGADFVFEDNYQLKKLEEVEAFVKQNKHLPEIAPASEMQNNGQGIGEMNTKLLQKVEELTLYLIEANKTIQNQNKRLEALEKAGIKK